MLLRELVGTSNAVSSTAARGTKIGHLAACLRRLTLAAAAIREGPAGLLAFRLHVGRPVQPMLAQTASSVSAALARLSPAAIEWKLDGARVQIHRLGTDIRVFTRSLDDVTARVPELVEATLSLAVSSVVLDGETIALQPDGRPHPFQTTGSRFGSRLDVERLRQSLPLTL